DFNRDGRLDVATVSDTKGIVVRLGNGNGTFQTMRSTALPRVNSTRLSPKSFAVGDLNNDGKLDVAVIAHGPASSSGGHSFGPRGSIRTTPSYAVVLIGKANGSFSVGSTTYLGSSAAPIRNIALDDFNGDGKLDALMSNAVAAHVRAGQGNGQFGDSVAVPTKNIASPVV